MNDTDGRHTHTIRFRCNRPGADTAEATAVDASDKTWTPSDVSFTAISWKNFSIHSSVGGHYWAAFSVDHASIIISAESTIAMYISEVRLYRLYSFTFANTCV